MRYTDAIGQCERGTLLQELDAAMANLALQCQSLNKSGTLTLTLELKPSGDNGLAITGDMKVKAPPTPRKSTFFFIDEYGELHRKDPRQSEMPFSAVPAKASA